MNKKIVLVGPPGVGKSTIINLAKKQGINAVDMEDYGPEKSDRIQKLEKILNENPETTFFGAADIGSSFPGNFTKILLLPSKSTYLRRFQKRNNLHPDKEYQKGEEIYDWFEDTAKNSPEKYSRVIRDATSPEEILRLILDPKTS